LRELDWHGATQGAISRPMLLAVEVCGVAFAWLVIRLRVGRDWPRVLGLRRPSGTHVALALLALPALLTLGGGLHELAARVLPSFKDAGLSGMEDLVKEFRSWDWAFAVLVVGAGPAVSEELWCRGFLGRGLTRQYGVAAGVLLTSVFFGVMHLDPPQAVATAFLGLVFHYTYVTSRSLWLPMLLHFVNNSVAVVAAKLADP